MKRTGEFVQSILAAAINFLALFYGARALTVNPSVLKQQLRAAGSAPDSQDINNAIHLFHTGGSVLIILSIVSIIPAGIALILLKRSHPKLGGWLLILSGAASLIEIVPGILYIIAGIMALVRKPAPQ
ncbi:DUF4064 domain-containing protein [Sporolactobacillus sp. KGMB 08714]|uniref:DUF4064 domain-containing protein n=1 Tax=Sporolactobacillus sp. KGMB 08714 TaxID=3064704 RepID=UPI002FBEA2F8